MLNVWKYSFVTVTSAYGIHVNKILYHMNLILYIFNVTILHTHLYIYIYTHTHTHTHTHPYGSAAQHGPWPPFLVRFLDHTR